LDRQAVHYKSRARYTQVIRKDRVLNMLEICKQWCWMVRLDTPCLSQYDRHSDYLLETNHDIEPTLSDRYKFSFLFELSLDDWEVVPK